jgi:hypothetical protein
MKRRSFFQSIARAAAIVALAPQLAFRVKPVVAEISHPVEVTEVATYWTQTTRVVALYSEGYREAMRKQFGVEMPEVDENFVGKFFNS